jgi:hypothetical protein
MIAGKRGDLLYLSSEEASIRLVSPTLDELWAPRGGEPVIGRVGEKKLVEVTASIEARQ